MPVSKLLKLPYGSYLMVRLDYKIICFDELEAKIMRIIEMYMDDERRLLYKELLNDPKNAIEPEATVEVTRDVWAAISHRLFKNDLYDQEMSENTLKRAIKSLVKKKFIRVRDDRAKRYEAPKYQINTDVVQEALDTLGKIGKIEYQKLMVSKIDGIKNSSHQNLTPAGYQNLTPSSNSIPSNFDPHSRRITDSVEDTEEESTYSGESEQPTTGALAPTHTFSSQDVIDFVSARGYLVSIGYKLEPTPQAYRCEEPGKALWSVNLPGYPNGFETWTTVDIRQHAQRLKAASHADGLPGHDDLSAIDGNTQRLTRQQSAAEFAPAHPTGCESGGRRSTRTGADGNGVTPELSTRSASSPHASAKVEQAALLVVPAQPSAHVEKPSMPSESVKWCAETMVQLVECKIKKRYRESAREKQIAAARRILKDDPALTREQFILAYDERDDDWWHKHKGLLHVNHMAEKDRVHEMLDRIEVCNSMQARTSSGKSSNQGKPKDSGLVSWWDSETGEKRMMTYDEADEHGWNGGFGEFIQHTNYGRTAIV